MSYKSNLVQLDTPTLRLLWDGLWSSSDLFVRPGATRSVRVEVETHWAPHSRLSGDGAQASDRDE